MYTGSHVYWFTCMIFLNILLYWLIALQHQNLSSFIGDQKFIHVFFCFATSIFISILTTTSTFVSCLVLVFISKFIHSLFLATNSYFLIFFNFGYYFSSCIAYVFLNILLIHVENNCLIKFCLNILLLIESDWLTIYCLNILLIENNFGLQYFFFKFF